MHGLVWCKHERRSSRPCRADVSFRDVTIKNPDRECDQGCEWRHAPEAWAEIWEKSVSWVSASEEDGWLSEVAEAWGRWKSQHRKIMPLSPDVEKPFNSKVIKSFVPELRSRKCFCVSGFRCYLYMSYEHSMSISRTHVWLCNNKIFCESKNNFTHHYSWTTPLDHVKKTLPAPNLLAYDNFLKNQYSPRLPVLRWTISRAYFLQYKLYCH